MGEAASPSRARVTRYVVIGAGPCGGRAALELARHASPGRVTLVGNEALPPYERPPLSKAFLTAADDPPVPALFPAERLAAAGIEALLDDAALSIAPMQRKVMLASGRVLPYDRLLLATGAAARTLDLPGAALEGVMTLRSHADAARLRARLTTARNVAVVGGGFIGLECAAGAVARGLSVAILEAAPRLLSRVAPPALSDAVACIFEGRGAELHMDARPIGIRGTTGVEGILLDDGAFIAADLVIVGIGARPNTDLAATAGLAIDDGICTDSDGRTSDPAIFAAGDVARRRLGDTGAALRLEAWEPALDRGIAVAAAMLDRPPPRERAPWAWSDLFEHNVQVAGNGGPFDREWVVEGSSPGSLVVLHAAGDRLVGAATLDAGREMALCRRAIAAGSSVRDRPMDASFDALLAAAD